MTERLDSPYCCLDCPYLEIIPCHDEYYEDYGYHWEGRIAISQKSQCFLFDNVLGEGLYEYDPDDVNAIRRPKKTDKCMEVCAALSGRVVSLVNYYVYSS